MPYCKVDRIRLMTDDPRAKNCDAVDLRRDVDKRFYKKNPPIICTFCTGYCECDHPTLQKFEIEIECFDEEFDEAYISQILDDHIGKKCGEIGVIEVKKV